MAGSAMSEDQNKTLRTVCANCKKSISTAIETGLRPKETWGLIGEENGRPAIFPACRECYEAGWRPSGFRWMNGGV